jgi:hypothetical protein
VKHAAFLVLLLGCSDGASTPIDAHPVRVDAAPDAAPGCEPCDWLDEYQRRIVNQLAGGAEIAPGVTLEHRVSVDERDATRTYLLAELTALGLTAELAPYDGGTPNTTGANVVARLPETVGTADPPPIVVGAHFDGVSAGPAAADNATGVAIVLAAARHLRDVRGRRRPVVFVLFDQEELGLVGSEAFVAELVRAQTGLHSAHIFDMLSWDGDGDRAVELWSPSPALEALYRAHGPAAGTPIQSVTFAHSDHQSFLAAGFPAVGVGEEFVGGDHTPHYHQATDTVENVSFAHLAVVTHLALAVLQTAATEY